MLGPLSLARFLLRLEHVSAILRSRNILRVLIAMPLLKAQQLVLLQESELWQQLHLGFCGALFEPFLLDTSDENQETYN
jgi:hypothetical protein